VTLVEITSLSQATQIKVEIDIQKTNVTLVEITSLSQATQIKSM